MELKTVNVRSLRCHTLLNKRWQSINNWHVFSARSRFWNQSYGYTKNFEYRNRLDNIIYYAAIWKMNFYFLIGMMWYLPVRVFLRRLKIFHCQCCLFTLFSQFNLEKLCTLTRIFTYLINICCIISTWIIKIFINLCDTLFIFITYILFFWKNYFINSVIRTKEYFHRCVPVRFHENPQWLSGVHGTDSPVENSQSESLKAKNKTKGRFKWFYFSVIKFDEHWQ